MNCSSEDKLETVFVLTSALAMSIVQAIDGWNRYISRVEGKFELSVIFLFGGL